MEKKLCTRCAQVTWHNPTSSKYPGGRCTYCGHPVATSVTKREFNEALQRRQLIKLGRLA